MRRTNTSKTKIIIAAFVIATLISGCAAGGNAETRLINQVTDGVEGESNEIQVRNLKVIKQVDGTGVLIGTFINWADDADAISSITIDGLPAVLIADSLDLNKNTPITFVGDIANADASVTNMTALAGYRIPVVVTFAKAAPIEFDALIVTADGIYTDIENMRFKA
jgi:phosphohistidine swiveling domain-containing protein